jgi:hypothetical protein
MEIEEFVLAIHKLYGLVEYDILIYQYVEVKMYDPITGARGSQQHSSSTCIWSIYLSGDTIF